MDHDLANQTARQLHGIHWKLRSTETPQPTIAEALPQVIDSVVPCFPAREFWGHVCGISGGI